MSSSIELINPKAESVRRAAALQVISSDLVYLLSDALLVLGKHNWRHGARQRCEG